VLILPNLKESFVVYCDASKMGLGGVLMQNRQVVHVHVLKIWSHYLYGFKFEVFSEHKSLKYLFDQK